MEFMTRRGAVAPLMRRALLAGTAIGVILLAIVVGCAPGADPTATPGADRQPTATSNTAAPRELVLLTHDSFDIGEDVIASFEQANDARVTILKGGDAGETLTKAILTRDNPTADVLYGVDNTFLGRALEEGVFLEYRSPILDKVPQPLHLDPTGHVMPVDYGYVNLNYDKAWLLENGLTPPADLRELTQPQWKDRLVVMNPATSSPGLAFLLTTIARFPEGSGYDWKQFWADLRDNGVLVTDGWTDAYYSAFSLYGGDRPLVVSYATSPAAEVFYSEGAYQEPPTGNVLAPQTSFLQIEGVGILNGSENVDLARTFVDFMMSERFQEDFPTRMWVYPVNEDAETPEVFQFAEEPQDPVTAGSLALDENRETWIDEWTRIVLR